jgi:dihydroorotate dehydrogenase (NAD+) catalytic subunit
VNTIRGVALDPVSGKPRLARVAGGYSGPALKPVALASVWACASAVDVPIVGMGGISTVADVGEFVSVGASAVALGTALFSDPWAPGRLRGELADATTVGSRSVREAPRESVV